MLVIDSNKFSYNSKTRTFAAEDSDLDVTKWDIRNGEIGFWMKSHKTGRTVWFSRGMEQRDADGDLIARKYINNELNLECVIFND
jgi:hypothetical protein